VILLTNSNRFREGLREINHAKFLVQADLAKEMSAAVSRVGRRRKLRSPDVIEGVMIQLVSAVQAAVPETEWDDVGRILATEIRDRLTVTGVT
jgi:hypothetical protein